MWNGARTSAGRPFQDLRLLGDGAAGHRRDLKRLAARRRRPRRDLGRVPRATAGPLQDLKRLPRPLPQGTPTPETASVRTAARQSKTWNGLRAPCRRSVQALKRLATRCRSPLQALKQPSRPTALGQPDAPKAVCPSTLVPHVAQRQRGSSAAMWTAKIDVVQRQPACYVLSNGDPGRRRRF